MKNKYLAAAFAIVSLGFFLTAQKTYSQSAAGTLYSDDYVNKLGLGVEFGAPIGVTAKYWLTQIVAIDGSLGWSPYAHSAAEMHADLLIHNFNLLTPSSGKMPFYFGVGILGRFRNDGRSNLAGVRFPFGVSYMLEDAPIDVFAEIAPEAIFAPFGRCAIDGAVGIRFWF